MCTLIYPGKNKVNKHRLWFRVKQSGGIQWTTKNTLSTPYHSCAQEHDHSTTPLRNDTFVLPVSGSSALCSLLSPYSCQQPEDSRPVSRGTVPFATNSTSLMSRTPSLAISSCPAVYACVCGYSGSWWQTDEFLTLRETVSNRPTIRSALLLPLDQEPFSCMTH